MNSESKKGFIVAREVGVSTFWVTVFEITGAIGEVSSDKNRAHILFKDELDNWLRNRKNRRNEGVSMLPVVIHKAFRTTTTRCVPEGILHE